MAPDRTYRAVARQLGAMGTGVFEIGLRQERTGSFRQTVMETTRLLTALSWLKHLNARSHHIYLRPAGSHGLILLDDLAIHALWALKRDGLAPAAVIATSPGNYQAWIKLFPAPRSLPHALATHLAQMLACRYGGDLNSADWHHYGRLAGFTNRKPQYRDARGFFPYVLIHQWSGHQAPRAQRILDEARHSLIVTRQEPSTTETRSLSKAPDYPSARTPSSPRQLYRRAMAAVIRRCQAASWIAHPDWSRMDFMVAKNMHRAGYTTQEIYQALLEGSPNLETRKAGHREDYLHRTLTKALGSEPGPPRG